MVDLDDLIWQQEPWSNDRFLWLRDNLMSYESMSEFVFETQEFKQTLQKVDEQINSARYRGDSYIDCNGDFAEWLWSIGGCYVGNFDAQDVIAWAIEEALAEHGFEVGEYAGRPVCIIL